MAILCIYKWGTKRAGLSNMELQLEEILKERQELLKDSIFKENGHVRR
jgi:hypothetical protein